LSDYFLKKYATLNHSKVRGFNAESMKKLEQHFWRGNVQELENTIERAVVLSSDDLIKPEDLALEDNETFNEPKLPTNENYYEEIKSISMSLEELSKKYIRFIFDKNRGAKEQTAKDLGIDRKTLYRKLKEMNLEGTT
jgi:DNA-binding NtrC family response regulator